MSKKARTTEQAQETVNGAKAAKVSNAKEKSSKKPEKKKERKKLSKTVRETASEIKKVNWPTFKEVAKKTGVVLTVVLVFGVVLLGVDYLLGLLFGLLK